MTKKNKTLYLCYFGLREPLVQSQVLPYLRQISKDDIGVSILTFEQNPKEKWTAEQIEFEKKKLADEGIKSADRRNLSGHRPIILRHRVKFINAGIGDRSRRAFFRLP